MVAVARTAKAFERAVSAGCVGRLGRMVRELAIPVSAGTPLFLNVHPQELQEAWLVRPDDPLYTHDHDVYLEITESVLYGSRQRIWDQAENRRHAQKALLEHLVSG